ncbi:MAG: NitT/TauT family transport system permease protein [Aliidongia sp.]|jgi:NitT/TauT family transport system permease protein|nr:NitT/TauT family transport system permease protein [Aliidongia sp.]
MQRAWGQANVAWLSRLRPNGWDAVALPIVLGFIALMAYSGEQAAGPFQLGDQIPISLDPSHLPEYAMRTVLRMAVALIVSLVFSVVYAALAAKSRQAEKMLIPILDILQSLPILAFEAVAVVPFIRLFPGQLLGVECAAIFAIFSSQAWNMTFSLYQSFRTVPGELKEAARMYHLTPMQTFWRLEVPYAMPGLVWNMMMSVSGGWFFVVASEAFTVDNNDITLPGIGSYIKVANDQGDLWAILYAVIAMLIVILMSDQLLFRPLLTWSQKFKNEMSGEDELERPWFLIALQRARVFDLLEAVFEAISNVWIGLLRLILPPGKTKPIEGGQTSQIVDWTVNVGFAGGALYAAWALVKYVTDSVPLHEIEYVALLGGATSVRVIVMIALASIIWVPIGVWVGLRPKLAQSVQPVIQFLAAFPTNLFFPFAVALILRYALNTDMWLSPLMILGTQWYILFNVIGGTMAIPSELHYAAQNLGVRRWLWWRRVILPGIFPAYVTGALTAAGGSWNASIVAEIVQSGGTTLTATGIGAYFSQVKSSGDFPRIVLSTSILCIYVILFNRLLWRRLYNLAAEKLRLD